jgi:hypothetical protein
MSRRSSKRPAASARLHEHLSVIRACEKSRESLKSYAERHGVSVHALYQAKKTARKQGLLPPHRAARSNGSGPKAARRSRFVEARSTASMPRPIRPTWRIRFASGDVLESDAPLSMDDVVRLAVRIRGQS